MLITIWDPHESVTSVISFIQLILLQWCTGHVNSFTDAERGIRCKLVAYFEYARTIIQPVGIHAFRYKGEADATVCECVVAHGRSGGTPKAVPREVFTFLQKYVGFVRLSSMFVETLYGWSELYKFTQSATVL